jgi:enterochelin esterase-like enzyme
MGALVSLYALNEYPQVFGRAGCLSTHWPAGGSVLVEEMAAGLPAPGSHRIWFDHGDATLDAGYAPFQQRMDTLLCDAGWLPGRDFQSQTFPGAEHSEGAWRARLDLPLKFLLG